MKKLKLGEEELRWENDLCRFYETAMSQELTKKAREMDIHGIELRGWLVVVAEFKENNRRMYLIVDSDGQPVRDDPTAEGISATIDFIKMAKLGDYDIVEMAEKRHDVMMRKKDGKRKLGGMKA